jgi:integrase
MSDRKKRGKIGYNIDMENNIKYSLFKNVYNGKTRYNIAFPNPDSKGYSKITILRKPNYKGRGKAPTTDDLVTAEAWALLYIADMKDQAKKARIAARKQAEEESALGDSIEDFYGNFWKEDSLYIKRHKVSPQTLVHQRRHIEMYFLPWVKLKGYTRIGQIKKTDMLEWQDWMMTIIEENHFKPSLCNGVLQSIKVPTNWALKNDKIFINFLITTEKVEEGNHSRAPFTLAEVNKLLEANWKDKRGKVAMMIAATTGMRIGEIQGLTWECVDLETNRISVKQQWQEHLIMNKKNKREPLGLCTPKSKKNDAKRPDPYIHPIVKKELLKLKMLYGSKFVFPETSNIHIPMTRFHFNMALRDGCKAAGVEQAGRTWHCFRNFHITYIEGVAGLDLASKMIGHKNTDTTLGYISVTSQDQEKYDSKVLNMFSKRA